MAQIFFIFSFFVLEVAIILNHVVKSQKKRIVNTCIVSAVNFI